MNQRKLQSDLDFLYLTGFQSKLQSKANDLISVDHHILTIKRFFGPIKHQIKPVRVRVLLRN